MIFFVRPWCPSPNGACCQHRRRRCLWCWTDSDCCFSPKALSGSCIDPKRALSNMHVLLDRLEPLPQQTLDFLSYHGWCSTLHACWPAEPHTSSNAPALLKAFLGQIIYRPSLQFTTVTSALVIFTKGTRFFSSFSSIVIHHNPPHTHVSWIYKGLSALVEQIHGVLLF